MIADDDDAFAAAIAAVLSRNPQLHIVGRARHGREAVELSQKLNPDIVLMDIYMPVLDGVEATEEIARTRNAPSVIIVSGSDYAERALEARLAGAVDFVRKGRLDQELLEAVTGAMSGRTDAQGNAG